MLDPSGLGEKVLFCLRPIVSTATPLSRGMPHCCVVQRDLQPTVDYALVATWLRQCDTEHEHSPTREDPCKELASDRVIDVQKQCVVRKPRHASYAALSYTWGSTSRFCLTQRNLHTLEQIGSLRTLDTALGSTITDSITACARLGIAYLWIDSLCIVQDDEEGKLDQIKNMDQIYVNAYVTLVAAADKRSHAESNPSRQTVDPGFQELRLRMYPVRPASRWMV